jgi:hypothetical protein
MAAGENDPLVQLLTRQIPCSAEQRSFAAEQGN